MILRSMFPLLSALRLISKLMKFSNNCKSDSSFLQFDRREEQKHSVIQINQSKSRQREHSSEIIKRNILSSSRDQSSGSNKSIFQQYQQNHPVDVDVATGCLHLLLFVESKDSYQQLLCCAFHSIFQIKFLTHPKRFLYLATQIKMTLLFVTQMVTWTLA